jgi:molybdopterin-dependent oxidoreductase-like protein protein
MKRRRAIGWIAVGLLGMGVCAMSAQAQQGSAPAAQAQTAAHTDAVKAEPFKVAMTADALKGLPRKTVTVHNPHANADETYEGVALGDLLAKYGAPLGKDLLAKYGAPLGKDLRGPALAYYVVATGSDGYKAVYSLAEVDPSFHPGDVLVADTMDGKPLDAHTGPLRLVSTEDKRPARGVRNLVSMELKAAE